MTPEATFKGVRIKSERGAGRPLGQDGPSAKILPIAINETRQCNAFQLKAQLKLRFSKTRPPADYGGPKCNLTNLDEFRYSGAYEVVFYESRKIEVQIRICNR